ncbi:MAG: hypothetical protein RIF32_11305 [Leptospirales bacterium]|jgi:hypothetical protein
MSDSQTPIQSGPAPDVAGHIDEAAEKRMRRAYRIAFSSFLTISGFYLFSGVLGMALAGVEMAGPPPEAEIPVVPAMARFFGSLIVISLGVPGIIAFLKRRQSLVLGYLKIGGIVVLVLHTVLAAFSLEAPRIITVFLMVMAILGMWITLVSFHPRTPAIVDQTGSR